jgi:hypothetical protein
MSDATMRRRLVLLVLLTACARDPVALEVEILIAGDAGPVPCSTYRDLACVNFISFEVEHDGEIVSRCVRVAQTLGTICDLPREARGEELFRVDPDDEITITISGLRTYPDTSCQVAGVCPARQLFLGSTGKIRLRDAQDGKIKLPITEAGFCGDQERWVGKGATQTCADSCSGEDYVVCDGVLGGCLCRDPGTGVPDGGLELEDARP